MAKKPTYEEIEQRLKELKQENCELRRLQDTLYRKKENFRIFTDNSLIGVSLISRDGKYLYINPKFTEIFGYTLEDVPTGKDWFEKAYPDIDYRLEVTSTWISDLKESKIGESRPRIFTVTCRDGSKKVIKFIPVMLETKNQLIFYEDITKAKQTEDALRESEEKYRTIVDNAKELIIVVQDGEVCFANRFARELFGSEKEELTFHDFLKMVHPDDQKIILERIQRRQRGEKVPDSFEYTVKKEQSSTIWVESRSFPIIWDARPAIIIFSADITERKGAEEAVRTNEEKYRELFENESDAVMIFDAETFLFEDANKATFDLYGYSRKEFLKLNVEDISAEKEKTRVAVQKVLNDKPGSKRVALRYFRKKDGTVFPGEISASTFIAGGRKKIIGAVRDITERIQAEESLRASEEKYRLVVNNAPIGIVVAQGGCLKFVNPVVMNISGYSEKELTDRPLVDFVHPDDREMAMAQYMKRLSGEKIPKPYELRIVSKEGKIRWVENSGVVISWEGQPATLNFLTDITEHKLIEEALRQNEKRFQKIVESAPFGYYRLGKDGRYQYVNPEWESMHGLSRREIIGKSVDVTEADENKARVLEYFHRALDGQTIKGESKRILKNGSYGYHEFSIQPVYQSGEIVAIECFLNDLTEQKRNEDLVRNLSHLLMQAQERERQMISYELHDRIAQNLSTLKIECTMLFEGQPAISRELEEKIARMSKLIEITITSVRDLAYNLRPPGLNEMSIVKAVEIYCEEFSASSGLGVDFQSTGVHALNFDYDTKIHIYRLVQEGLNNIRKHADASRATVKMIGASPNIILRIEDNGKGFDVKERERSFDSRKRMGLRSMQERVNLLGGQMTIRSRPMTGTKIFIRFPFEEKESDREKAHLNR